MQTPGVTSCNAQQCTEGATGATSAPCEANLQGTPGRARNCGPGVLVIARQSSRSRTSARNGHALLPPTVAAAITYTDS
jgi:hypothetical protein